LKKKKKKLFTNTCASEETCHSQCMITQQWKFISRVLAPQHDTSLGCRWRRASRYGW